MLRRLHRALILFPQNGWVTRRCGDIGRSLHYTKNSLSSSCTSQHKHEQKDKNKDVSQVPRTYCLYRIYWLWLQEWASQPSIHSFILMCLFYDYWYTYLCNTKHSNIFAKWSCCSPSSKSACDYTCNPFDPNPSIDGMRWWWWCTRHPCTSVIIPNRLNDPSYNSSDHAKNTS